MKRFLLIFACLIATPMLAQITNVSVVGLTPTQAIIQFNDSTSTFTLAVSESASYSPVVADVDTTKFGPNANNSTRALNPTGTTWRFVVGSIPNATGKVAGLSIESTPLVYGRALQPNTVHYFKITDGANTATGTFTTPNLPLGKTYGEPSPIIGGATTWQASTSYSPGNLVLDSNGYIEQAQGPAVGTSGGSAPTWPVPGSTVTDSGVTWLNKGTMWGYPTYFTAGQWALANPMTFTMRDPNTGLPINFVTLPSLSTNDTLNHAFSTATGSSWTNVTNLLSNSGFATINCASSGCSGGFSLAAVVDNSGITPFGSAFYTDAVQINLSASSTVAGDKLNLCLTTDGVTCATPGHQFTLTASNAAYTFPPASCNSSRACPWGDWNAPLPPILGNTSTATSNQGPTVKGIGNNTTFGTLIWADASDSGTVSAQNVKVSVFLSRYIGNGYPDGGEEFVYGLGGTVNDGSGTPGYLNMPGYAAGNVGLNWLNSVTGEQRFLGFFVNPGAACTPSCTQLLIGGTETFSGLDPTKAYFLALDNNSPHKVHAVLCQLPASGNAAYNAPSAGYNANLTAPCTWTDLTKDNNPTTFALSDQIGRFDAGYSFTAFPSATQDVIQTFNGHDYLIFDMLVGSQNSLGYLVVCDLGAANVGLSCVIADGQTFANSTPTSQNGQTGNRWATFHTFHPVGNGTSKIMWAPHSAADGVNGQPVGTTACKLHAALNTTTTTGIQLDCGSPNYANALQQDIAIGDYFAVTSSECMEVNSVTKGVNVGGYSGTSYTVGVYSRGIGMSGNCPGSASAKSHSANDTVQMLVFATYDGGAGALFWWDFINDPSMTASVFQENLDNMAAHYAYTAPGTGNVTIGNGTSEHSSWSVGWNYSPATNIPGGGNIVNSLPAFNLFTVDTNGNAYQKHPASVHQVLCGANSNARCMQFGMDEQSPNVPFAQPQSWTNVSGQLFSFTPQGDATQTYTYKMMATLAIAGFHPLLDISGPSSVIDGTAASNYKWCYAFLAGECVGGSAAGTVYFNAPFFNASGICTNGNFGTNGWLPFTETQPCFTNYGGFGQNIAQFDLTTADSVGRNVRAISEGMAIFGMQSTFENPQIDPTGQWTEFPAAMLNGRLDAMQVKTPPFPSVSLNNDFIQKSVASGTPPGGTNSCMIEFGYDTNLFATGRAEKTVTVATTYNQANPFYFENSDSYTRPACSSAVTLIIPVIPGHVVYYRFVFCTNAFGTCTVNGGTQPTNVAADPSFATATISNPAPCPACFVRNSIGSCKKIKGCKL